jgi:iron(III) transport system permease protein
VALNGIKAGGGVAAVFRGSKHIGESPFLRVLWVAVLVFLFLFIIYPLFRVFGAAGLESWQRLFASSRWLDSLFHSLALVVFSTLLSVLTGFIYAYGVIRGALPFARFFAFVPILHLVTPPFVGGLSFILLFGRQGFFTKTLLGLDISLYGLPGLLIAQTLCFFPVAFLIIKDVLEGINPALEYAARSAGARGGRVFRTITLPLALPGIVSALLFIAISVLSDFGNPMLIGGRFNVLAVELYTRLSGWAEAGTSAALGIVLLVPASLLFGLRCLVLRNKNGRLATAGAVSSLPRRPPGPFCRALLFVFCALVALIVAAQFFAVIAGAFSKIWGVDNRFTVEHIRACFSYKQELRNTLVFAFGAALATAVLSALFAFLVQRTALPFRRAVDGIVMLPASLPGSLVGLAFVLAFNGRPFYLTGTGFIIILAMTICDLPAAYRIMSSSLMSIRHSLDDSARALGATRLKLFFTVICPLAAPGIVSAFVYTFVRATGTLSAVIFLMSFGTKLTSALILNLAAQGNWGNAAALALLLTGVIFLALALLRLVWGKQTYIMEYNGKRSF